MDLANRALCYALRHPPNGMSKAKYKDIAKVVKKRDGKKPTHAAIAQAAASFTAEKATRGRKQGTRKTSKSEDKVLLTTFKKCRPPGCGVDSRIVHTALPKKLKAKISRKTIIRRLAGKGYKPQKKKNNADPDVKLAKKRLAFVKQHQHRGGAQWKSFLQAVADIKEFTWYPKKLRGRFQRLKAPGTYMTKKEKQKPEFSRPKRWFPQKDWRMVKKQKVFGMTASTGDVLAFLVPHPWSTELWAKEVKAKVAPFLRKCFPRRSNFQILIDGEKLLHGQAAKDAMKEAGITTLPGWPKYSPDLNPQENVWAWAEDEHRKHEKPNDSFEVFKTRVRKAVTAYPSGEKLFPSMAKRCKQVIANEGGMCGK